MAGVSGYLAVQFHPDWPHGGGSVIGSTAVDGVYRTQFATGISNGGLTAFPGGDRWQWEDRLFEAKYNGAGVTDRPVYGAWNRHCDPYGGAVRFGSAYAELKPEVLERTTFCFPDSVFEPTDFGSAQALPQLCALADAARLDELDDYVEAHIHGPVRFDRDVAAVVLDPVFQRSPIEKSALELGCEVRFHPGFHVASASLDPGYRNIDAVQLAQSLGSVLTPDLVGTAARSDRYDLQSLKHVWHYLARFGRKPRR